MVTGLPVLWCALAVLKMIPMKKNNQSTINRFHVWSRPQQMVPLHHDIDVLARARFKEKQRFCHK